MWFVNLLLLILILGILIFVHELGHFLFAKAFKVHIYEFSIGMGPVIKRITGKKDKIEYSIRAFPIGGFVRMAGEVSEDDKSVKKEDFMCNKPWLQRVLILIAGVTFNFLTAIVLLFGTSLIFGSQNLTPKISEIQAGSAASKAGLEANDVITNINGYKIGTWDKLQIVLALKNESNEYTFTVKKSDNRVVEYKVTPDIKKNEDGNETKVFGISVDATKEKGLIPSLKYTFKKLGSTINSMALIIANLFTGKISLNSLSGPVGIYTIVGASRSAGIESILFLMAYLSINLGFINILPFPAFDGGRVLFLVIEKIKGSPVKPEVENIFHTVGFALLMLLMIYITFQDILKLF